MKTQLLLVSALFAMNTQLAFAQSFDLSKSINKAKDTVANATKNTNALSSAGLIAMASDGLGLSPEMTQAGIGALLNVAQQHLSKENFSTISGALPESKQYMDNAPTLDTSALTSMLGKSDDKAKTVASLGYLDSTFKQLGIPKESLVPLTNLLTGYLENNGYGQAAGLLKQGLNFL